jgi:arsenate reductase-like glutaredoxin family protein
MFRESNSTAYRYLSYRHQSREIEINEEGPKHMLSTPKDREQIEYLISRYEQSINNLVDLRNQIWDKLDTDDKYAASVTTRLSDITEKLAAAIAKTGS